MPCIQPCFNGYCGEEKLHDEGASVSYGVSLARSCFIRYMYHVMELVLRGPVPMCYNLGVTWPRPSYNVSTFSLCVCFFLDQPKKA